MTNFRRFAILIFIVLGLISGSCKDENHIDKYEVSVDSLKTLPDNFYAYRRGSIYIDTNNYMIWFNLGYAGNVKNVFKITDLVDKDTNQTNIIFKYKIDTTESKNIAQKFIDLSRKFKFGHINIERENKIAFSYKDGLREQYVITFNDSLKNIYSNDADFKLLENGWFENIEK